MRAPARSSGLGEATGAVGMTPIEQHAGPAVKISSPCLPPRDALCAVGGIRAWGENPGRRASSFTTVLAFERLRARTQKFGADYRGDRRTPLLADRNDNNRLCPYRMIESSSATLD